MARFDNAIALAKKLIAKNGQMVTLQGFSDADPADPDKPWRPGAAAPSNQPIEAVFLDYEQKYIDGETVRTGDQRVFIPAEGLTAPPDPRGTILRGVEVWKIVGLKPLNPNGQAVMYEAQVRQ